MLMTRASYRLALLAAFAACAPALARAQALRSHGADRDYSMSPPRVVIWGAATASAPFENGSDSSRTRTVVLLAVEHRSVLVSRSWATVSWAPALLPLVYTNRNVRDSGYRNCGTFDLCSVTAKYAAYGVGVVPVALRAQSAALGGRLRAVVRADGGGVQFSDRIPTPRGAKFNFLADVGAGLEWRVRSRISAVTEYRHLHLSNGGRGKINPGIDTNLMSMGVAWW